MATQKLEAVLSLRDRFSKALDKAKENTKNYGKEWKRQAKTVEKCAKQIESAGKKLSTHVTAPLMAIATASVASFKTINEGQQTIISKTGAVGEAAKDLEKVYHKTYSKLYFDANMVGSAIGEVNTQFALQGDALENLATYASKFSHINGTDVSKSIIDAKKVASQFNVEAKDTYLIFDAITYSGQATGVAVDKIFEMISSNAPVLKELGLNFAQSAAFMAEAERSGVDASQMMSYLTKSAGKFAKEGKTLNQGLNDVTLQIKNAKTQTEALNIANETFGKKGGLMMVNAIKEGRINIDQLSGSLKEIAGVTDRTEKEMRSPFDEMTRAIQPAKVALADLGANILQVALPYIKKASVYVQELSNKFKNLSPEQKEMIVKIGMVVASLGPFLMGLGKVISIGGKVFFAFRNAKNGVGLLGKAFKLIGVIATATGAPVWVVVAAIAGLIAIGVALYKNWDTIKKAGKTIWRAIKNSIKADIDFIKNLFGGMVQFVSGIVHGDWKEALEGLKRIAKAPLEWIENKIKVLKDLWESFRNFLKNHTPTISESYEKHKKSASYRKAGRHYREKDKTSEKTPKPKPPSPPKPPSSPKPPKIPNNATGNHNFQGGLTYINERMRGEIVTLPSGSEIIPHDRSIKKAYKDGQNSVNNNQEEYNINFNGAVFYVKEAGDEDKIADKVVKKIVQYKNNRKPKEVVL